MKIGTKVPCYKRNKIQKKFLPKIALSRDDVLQFPNMGKNLQKRVKWGLSLNCNKCVAGNFFSVLFFDSISKKVIKTNSIVKNSKF